MFFPHGMAFTCLRCGCVLQCIMITLVNIPASGLMIRIIVPWLHIPPPQWFSQAPHANPPTYCSCVKLIACVSVSMRWCDAVDGWVLK